MRFTGKTLLMVQQTIHAARAGRRVYLLLRTRAIRDEVQARLRRVLTKEELARVTLQITTDNRP